MEFAKAVMRPSLASLDLFSRGILKFKNAGDGDGAQKALGVACVAAGIAGFALLLPTYVVGQTLHNVATPEDMEHAGATNMASRSTSDPGAIRLFNLNAALGDKILYAVNFGGTPFGKISLSDRAEQVVSAILNEDPDIVTLQEIFSTDMGTAIADALSRNGYEVFFNAGSRFCGYAGYNSGLLTAVKVTGDGERRVVDHRYHRYSDSANVDRFAAKGVLLVRCTVGDGDREMVVANTHLMASDPAPGVEVAIRDSQIQEAVAWIADFASGAPAILAGDFNCYDHGVSQGNEWLADESNEALGISSTGRAYLAGFEEAYRFLDPTNGDASLPFPAMLVGSDVEDAAFATPFEQALGVLSGTPMPDDIGDSMGYYMTHFFKRLFRYRFPIPDLERPFNETVKQLDGYFDKEIALVVENRRIAESPQSPISLVDKISILLQGRDAYDVSTELEMLGTPATDLTPEEARRLLAEIAAMLVENDVELPPEQLAEANRCTFYRELQKQFFGRHRNDRVFHQKGAIEGHYSVRYDLMHLSDHLPLVGSYRFL
ncbi:hypothetical protein QKT49_gp158 [Acanthamoeba castellanii medusavirus]|uniref:Endonuclease/exonuclease/phosphatase domain-containing protein n=1 Tax=Acanthamoeba castellanii medusavirus J1 TaxID=3114988 RepID=A0A3T1CWV4_9VIRU|nr:hypothetical protein QKT49_gp158 [Acanthamoeba castellanii medusavirus]BBI30298.1 hypothetical protein [Acanthamoeba castellanii medusavirus J1]